MNTFEVEMKFRIREGSIAEFERQLRQRFGSGAFGDPVTESDSFFQHPCRDFVQTDECLRLRHCHFADGSSSYFLTYKGPRIDTRTKTRQELEMPMAEPEVCESLLVALGFRKVASVRKLRRRMELTLEQRRVTIVLDTLPDLPESARHFIEMEMIATKEDLDECRSLLFRMAEQLDLSEPIRDSYLKLVHG